MSFLAGATCERHVVIGGVSFSDHWIMCENLWILERSADPRGTDRLVPHAAGTRPKPRRSTVTKETLNLVITGAVDRTGAVVADPEAQLDDSLAYLRQQAVDPDDAGGLNLNADGTRDATLYLADGSSVDAIVHTGPLRPGDRFGPAMTATLDLSFPLGGFVLS